VGCLAGCVPVRRFEIEDSVPKLRRRNSSGLS